jgi:hypothetical protein
MNIDAAFIIDATQLSIRRHAEAAFSRDYYITPMPLLTDYAILHRLPAREYTCHADTLLRHFITPD